MLVLDDEMLILYHQFRRNDTNIDKDKVQKLFSNMLLPYKTNARQYSRCRKTHREVFNDNTLKKLLTNQDNSLDIEKLALSTIHKLILTADPNKKSIPYLNIDTQNVGLHYAITCKKGEARDELLKHIANLCATAKKISICDKYLWDNNSVDVLGKIFPQKALDIYCADEKQKNSEHYETVNSDAVKKCAKKYNCTDWKVHHETLYKLDELHDRYLVIDRTYEIILSSGFEYLQLDTKEITCIFRQKK